MLFAVPSDPTSGALLVVCLYIYKYEKILNERHEIHMFYFFLFKLFIHTVKSQGIGKGKCSINMLMVKLSRHRLGISDQNSYSNKVVCGLQCIAPQASGHDHHSCCHATSPAATFSRNLRREAAAATSPSAVQTQAGAGRRGPATAGRGSYGGAAPCAATETRLLFHPNIPQLDPSLNELLTSQSPGMNM